MPAFATPGPIAATVEVAGARVRVTETLIRRTTRSWFTPARGTATSSSNAQQADRQEASVTSTSSDQLVCVPSCVTSANRASPR